MGTFTPIAMRCTQEQFKDIKPKLKEIGKIGDLLFAFENDNLYLVNNYNGEKLVFDISYCDGFNRSIHEEWNEEIFLKACGIEVNTLEQQLQKAKSEVRRIEKLIEEENKPKVGDWLMSKDKIHIYKLTQKGLDVKEHWDQPYNKITNQELIKLLEQEIK